MIERLIPPVRDADLTALAQLLVDAVESGAAVSFLAPLTLERPRECVICRIGPYQSHLPVAESFRSSSNQLRTTVSSSRADASSVDMSSLTMMNRRPSREMS